MGTPGGSTSSGKKTCRACGEEIAEAALVCHICGTPQRGPMWLYRWKDVATAIIAILALVPWIAGFFAFVIPVFEKPTPDLKPILYGCNGSKVSLGVVNSGKAYGFITAITLRPEGSKQSVALMNFDRSPLGESSVIAPDKPVSLVLQSFSSGDMSSAIEQPVCTTTTVCTFHLDLAYKDKDDKPLSAAANGTCNKAG